MTLINNLNIGWIILKVSTKVLFMIIWIKSTHNSIINIILYTKIKNKDIY